MSTLASRTANGVCIPHLLALMHSALKASIDRRTVGEAPGELATIPPDISIIPSTCHSHGKRVNVDQRKVRAALIL